MTWPLPFHDPPAKRERACRRLLHCAGVALLAFVATGVALRLAADAALPPVDRGAIAIREARYGAQKDSVDTLLLGTRRLQFGVDSAVLDAEMTAQGCPTRSLNLSLAGLNIRELAHLLEMIRDDPPPRLELLLVEPRPNRSRDLEALLTPRFQATLGPRPSC
jgi:hypothetical protein